MELKSNQIQKRLIDCTVVSENLANNAKWSFEDLSNCYVDGELSDYKGILGWCIDLLRFSVSASLMLKEAREKGWFVAFEDLRNSDYCIDVEERLLIIDSNILNFAVSGRSSYFRNTIVLTMIKALRDIWQENRHGGFDELYSPEYIILMERIRAADLDVVAILVAWELSCKEYPKIWNHVMGSDINDMAMVFLRHLERVPPSLSNNNGNGAIVASFKQWFNCARRVDICDHEILEYMDDILVSTSSENAFGRKRPSKMSVEILSCLPNKTAYLQGLGSEILSNPVYSSINNEINQTHLLHIIDDLEVVTIENVAFRDKELAYKIFPIK